MIASTGVASTKMTLVEYSDQMNTGRRYQVRPGARRRWMVTMKFRPVAMVEKPEMKMPITTGDDVALGIVAGQRGVEGPAGIDAAGEQRIQTRRGRRP